MGKHHRHQSIIKEFTVYQITKVAVSVTNIVTVKFVLTVTEVLLASILWLRSDLTRDFGVFVLTSAGLDLNIWPAAWTTEKFQIITHRDIVLVDSVYTKNSTKITKLWKIATL